MEYSDMGVLILPPLESFGRKYLVSSVPPNPIFGSLRSKKANIAEGVL
jgi:hypothetical protein